MKTSACRTSRESMVHRTPQIASTLTLPHWPMPYDLCDLDLDLLDLGLGLPLLKLGRKLGFWPWWPWPLTYDLFQVNIQITCCGSLLAFLLMPLRKSVLAYIRTCLIYNLCYQYRSIIFILRVLINKDLCHIMQINFNPFLINKSFSIENKLPATG